MITDTTLSTSKYSNATTRKNGRNLSIFPKLAFMIDGAPDGVGMQFLHKQGLELLKKLIRFYDAYDGKRYLDTGMELTPERIKVLNNLDYMPTVLVVNLLAWFVDRLAAFMFEGGVNISCPPEQVDSAEDVAKPDYKPSNAQVKANAVAAAREQLLYKITKRNKLAKKLLQAAKDYVLGTGVCAKLWMSGERGLRIIWRPRLEYWPIYDADDVDELEKIHFIAYTDDETIWKQSWWMQPPTADLDDEQAPSGTRTCWMEEKTYDLNLNVKETRFDTQDTELPFMPIEVFTRGGLTGETEGRSLAETIFDINREIEKRLSDSGDALRFGMFAIKVLLNAVQPSKEQIESGEAEALKVQPNALWQLLGHDGVNPPDIKTLENEFKYKEALQQYIDTLVAMMHKLSNVPNIDPEQIKGLGQLSGFAIRLMYGNIISATNQNMIVWKPGLKSLLGKALYMLKHYPDLAARHYNEKLLKEADLDNLDTADLDELVDITVNLPIPQNEAELVDLETKKVAAMLQTIKDAMKALGVEDPERKLAELLSEKTSIRDVMVPPEEIPNDKDRSGGSATDVEESGGDGTSE